MLLRKTLKNENGKSRDNVASECIGVTPKTDLFHKKTALEGHDPAKPVTDAQYESVYREPLRATAVKPVGERSESLGGRYSHLAAHDLEVVLQY